MPRPIRALLLSLGAGPAGGDEGVLTLDAAALELESVFSGPLDGEARAQVLSDEAFSFQAPDELAALGVFWAPHVESLTQLKAAVKDAHDRLRRRLDDDAAALARLGFNVSLEAPRAQALGEGVQRGHSLAVTLGAGGELLLERVGSDDVPADHQEVARDLERLDFEELGERLRQHVEKLVAQGLVEPADEAAGFEDQLPTAQVSSTPSGEPATALPSAAQGDDGSTPQVPLGVSRFGEETGEIEPMRSAAEEDGDIMPSPEEATALRPMLEAGELDEAAADAADDGAGAFAAAGDDDDEDEATIAGMPVSALVERPSSSASASELVEESPEASLAQLDDEPSLRDQVVATFQDDAPQRSRLQAVGDDADGPPRSLDMDLDAVAQLALQEHGPEESEEPAAPEEPGGEETPREVSLEQRASAEASQLEERPEDLPAVAEHEDDFDEQELPRDPTDPTLPLLTRQRGSVVAAAAADSFLDEASDEGLSPASAGGFSDPRMRALADVVGEGLSSGKTGAIELDAEAFAELRALASAEQDIDDEAENLCREAALLEARARELRAQADLLRQRRGGRGGRGKRRLAEALEAHRASAEGVAIPDPSEPSSESAFASREGVAALAAKAAPVSEEGVALADLQALLDAELPPSDDDGGYAATQVASLELGDLAGGSDADGVFEEGSEPAVAPPNTAVKFPPAASSLEDLPSAASADVEALASLERSAAGLPAFGSFSSADGAPVQTMAGLSPGSLPSVDALRAFTLALVVDDARARGRLKRHLGEAFPQVVELARAEDAVGLADLGQIDAVVLVRPPSDAATQRGLEVLDESGSRPPVLVLSSDPVFDSLKGVDLRVELGRRASEVAKQVVDGLTTLGVDLSR